MADIFDQVAGASAGQSPAPTTAPATQTAQRGDVFDQVAANPDLASSNMGTTEQQQPGVLSMLGDVASTAINHPLDTLKGAGTIVKGMADTMAQQMGERYRHPFRTLWSNIKGTATGIDDLNPVGIQAGIRQVRDLHDNIEFFQQKRKEGLSVKDSLDATQQEAQRKSAPHILFREPDQNDSADVHMLYDFGKEQYGEYGGRALIAARRIMEGELEAFKKNPDEFMSNVSVKLLPLLVAPEAAGNELRAGGGAIEEGGETVANATRAEASAARLAEKTGLPKGEPASVAPADTSQEFGQQGLRDILNKVAEENGLPKSESTSIRDAAKDLGDAFKAKSKAAYAKIDEASSGQWQTNENALAKVERDLRVNTDVENEAALQTRKADLLAKQEEVLQQAEAKGVPKSVIDEAKSNYRKAYSSYDIGRHVEGVTSGTVPEAGGTETVNFKSLANRLNKGDMRGMLSDVMGKENANNLLSHVNDTQKLAEGFKNFEPSTATGQKAFAEIVAKNTKPGGLTGKPTVNWGKALEDFDRLTPQEQSARFGSDAVKLRSQIVRNGFVQSLPKYAAKTGIGSGLLIGLSKEFGLW